MAKFLIMTQTNDHPSINGGAHGGAHRISHDFMEKAQQHGIVEAYYHILPNRGLAIVNAKTHEDLFRMISQYPGFYAVKMEIHALADPAHAYKNPIAMPPEIAKQFGIA